jgi:hypothetical protein
MNAGPSASAISSSVAAESSPPIQARAPEVRVAPFYWQRSDAAFAVLANKL